MSDELGVVVVRLLRDIADHDEELCELHERAEIGEMETIELLSTLTSIRADIDQLGHVVEALCRLAQVWPWNAGERAIPSEEPAPE